MKKKQFDHSSEHLLIFLLNQTQKSLLHQILTVTTSKFIATPHHHATIYPTCTRAEKLRLSGKTITTDKHQPDLFNTTTWCLPFKENSFIDFHLDFKKILPQALILSILPWFLTLVASLSDREVDVSTPERNRDEELTSDILTSLPPAVPVSRPPLLVVPHGLHSPLVKVWPREVAQVSVKLPVAYLTIVEVQVLAAWTLPLSRSVLFEALARDRCPHPGPVVLQVLLLKVTIVPVTTIPSRIVQVVALRTLPIYFKNAKYIWNSW